MKTNPVFSSINFLRRNLWIKHHMFTDVFARFIFIIDLTRYYTNVRGVYQFDRWLALGARGCGFESRHPDHNLFLISIIYVNNDSRTVLCP